MLGIIIILKWLLLYIDTSFVIIALQKRAQGDKIGFNDTKKNVAKLDHNFNRYQFL